MTKWSIKKSVQECKERERELGSKSKGTREYKIHSTVYFETKTAIINS